MKDNKGTKNTKNTKNTNDNKDKIDIEPVKETKVATDNKQVEENKHIVKTIKKAETEMVKILNHDTSSWTRFYLILKDVEEQKLYKDKFKSFTQWVKHFCIENKISESIVWSRKTAGQTYEKYRANKKAQGIEVKPLEETDVSVDALCLINKITKADTTTGAELVEKAINKDLKRQDLRLAYDKAKELKVKKIEIQDKLNLNDEALQLTEEDKKKLAEEEMQKNSDVMKTLAITNAFNDCKWLGIPETKSKKYNFNRTGDDNKYKNINEFPVFTGTSRKSRRIDVVIAENITIKEHWDLVIHGVEIKVSESDLKKDKKYTEYADFVDFLWIAMPKAMYNEKIKGLIPANLGILLYEDEKIVLERQALKGKPQARTSTLTTLALKLI